MSNEHYKSKTGQRGREWVEEKKKQEGGPRGLCEVTTGWALNHAEERKEGKKGAPGTGKSKCKHKLREGDSGRSEGHRDREWTQEEHVNTTSRLWRHLCWGVTDSVVNWELFGCYVKTKMVVGLGRVAEQRRDSS